MFAAPALKPFVREECLPGMQAQGVDELLDYTRRNGGTCYHASCTCLMGSHANAVDDDELNVHGLDGLRRLGDAGRHLTPTPTRRTFRIVEKDAAMIQKALSQRLAV
jgi:choline dehydrogenase